MSKAKKKVKSAFKKVADKAVSEVAKPFTIGDTSGGFFNAPGFIQSATGVDTRKVTPAAQLKRQFIEKPAEEKARAKALSQEAARQEKTALANLDRQKKQSEAEASASENLARAKSRQSRKSKGTGRRSTILTDKLGNTGGEAEKRSLLGL